MTISQTSYKINTILPDGSVLANFLNDNSPAAYSGASIGELKELEVVYTIDAAETFVGKTIYITGGFVGIGNLYPTPTPTSGYNFYVGTGVANSIVYNVPYIGCVNNGAQNEMYKVTVEFTNIGTASAETCTIKVQQILSYDIEAYRLCNFFDNQSRLLKSLAGEASTLPTIANTDSFYNNTQKVLSSVVRFYEGSDFFREEFQIPFQAAWYNKDPLNATPFFSHPTVSLEVNGILSTGISPVKNTKVTLVNTCPVQPEKLVAILIDVTNNDQTIKWWDNYDYSAAVITTVGGISSLSGTNSKFKSPSQAPTNTIADTYESFFEIDYTQIIANHKYRILWILYNVDEYYNTDDKVNSFISDEFTANFYEPFSGDEFELTGKFSDYQTVFLGNDLEVVPEERIKAMLDLSYWDGVNNSLSDTLISRFGTAPTATPGDIRSSLKKINIIFSYEETIAGQLYKHILDDVIIIRTGLNTYLLPDGTEFIAIGTDLSLPAFEQAVRIAYTFRVRYESDILNIRSYINGVLQPSPLSTQDWTNKTILIDWTLFFEYELITPIETDTIYFQHQIRVKDYENNRDEADRNLDFLEIEDTLAVVCEGDELCPVSTKIDLPDDYRHIVNLDRTSYKIQNIEEEETWEGVLPILSTDKLTNVDSDYVDEEAQFCVDLSLLNKNIPYKYAAIAKKLKNPACMIFGTKDIPLSIVDGVWYITGGYRFQLLLTVGSLSINWGDGNTTIVLASASIQTFTHSYDFDNVGGVPSEHEISICGNCENISNFIFQVYMDGAEPKTANITSIDITRMESDLSDFINLRLYTSLATNILFPTTAKNYQFIQIFGYDSSFKGSVVSADNLRNSALTTLDLSTMSGNFGTFIVDYMQGLTTLTLNSSTIITTTFRVLNTLLNQTLPFGTQIFASSIIFRNTTGGGFTGVLTTATMDNNINEIYANRVAYSVQQPGAKVFTGNGTNQAPSGTLTAPTGYIQADAVTVGNDGTPANAKEQIYVLVNQNIDNTTTKKYNWTFNVN